MLPLAVSIPTYNRADILADRLDRMSRMQRRLELEISISDDASTDHTPEIARELAGREKKLPRRILFIAFTGEERGLLGSARYVRNPLVPLDKLDRDEHPRFDADLGSLAKLPAASSVMRRRASTRRSWASDRFPRRSGCCAKSGFR